MFLDIIYRTIYDFLELFCKLKILALIFVALLEHNQYKNDPTQLKTS